MKNRTIAKRLTVQIGLLLVSFSVVLLLANSLLLKPLYERSEKNKMIDGIYLLSEIDFTSDYDDWSAQLLELSPKHSYDITIFNDDVMLYSSSREYGFKDINGEMLPPPNSFDLRGELNTDITEAQSNDRGKPGTDNNALNSENEMVKGGPIDNVAEWAMVENNIYLGISNNPSNGSSSYVMKTELDTGVEIILSQNIEPIADSVRQANILLVSVSLLFLVLGISAAFVVSKRFTHPIKGMQEHVGKLTRLEFGEDMVIETGDELQDLSEDIGLLAYELEKALSTLQKQNKQLEKEIKSQRKFISNASHELRTPLALIKGYADEIAGGFVKNRDQEHMYVGYIAEESSKMKRLLNEILEFSRVESGRMELNPANVNIKDAIEGFVDKYSGFIEEHELNLDMKLDDGIGYFDQIRFEQILANYLSNSAKYCDSKKEVFITCNKIEEKNVFRVTVTNSGGPISDEAMQFIWDGFYKADESRSGNDGSYGLGLSIVKALQNMTGMEYGCSNEDGYVNFWFDVEVTQPSEN